jgi:hypothetical protein
VVRSFRRDESGEVGRENKVDGAIDEAVCMAIMRIYTQIDWMDDACNNIPLNELDISYLPS